MSEFADFLLARIAEDERAAGGSRVVPKPSEQIECVCGDRGYLTQWGSKLEITHHRGWAPPEIRAGWIMDDGHSITETHVLDGDAAAAIHAAWPLAASSARVLAECDAKRQIIELHAISGSDVTKYDLDHGAQTFGCTICHNDDGIIYGDGYCLTLRLLALPYADHPDYRQEWRP